MGPVPAPLTTGVGQHDLALLIRELVARCDEHRAVQFDLKVAV